MLAAAALALGACSSEEEQGDDTTTSSAVATRPDDAGGDPELVGTWGADAGPFLDSAFAAEELEEPVTCEGDMALEFGADGAFEARIDGTCAFAEGQGVVDIGASGWHVASGGILALSGVEGRSVLVGEDGEELPLALATFDDGELPYAIDGDRLAIGDPAAGEGLAYTRR